jgi:signal transduction histidine kinase
MRRLYLKIYLVFIATLLTVLVIVGLFWRMRPPDAPHGQVLELTGKLVSELLPPEGAPDLAQRQAVERLARRLHADIALFGADFTQVAAAGHPVPPPSLTSEGGVFLPRQGPPEWSFHLPDGRWLVARPAGPLSGPISRALVFLVAMAVIIAIFAYPVVRGLTKRIERLQAGVETLGAGNLAARVSIGGCDEVARLADSFNRAAEHIQELVGAHRLLLANASHELRTPLSRLRLGIELYAKQPSGEAKAELQRDIAELDDLIEEILLASRLDVTAPPLVTEPVDLLALVAEECAHYDDCTLEGTSVSLCGDPRLLRRLVRNLLENAARHGRPPVRVELRRKGGNAVLCVIDAGTGIPEALRERVFLPFFQLAGDRKGSGLGLSLVRQSARLHGGDAVAATRPDSPSCFVITIPIGEEATAAAPKEMAGTL